MGLFDTVRCFMVLPRPDNDTSDVDYNSLEYQTKDLYSAMERYAITKHGQLKIEPDVDIGQSLTMRIYTIHKGCWIEYEFLIENGKGKLIELIDYRNLKENSRWKLT